MPQRLHPILEPAKRSHREGDYAREEVALANRNCGMPLEMLRHEITPAGMHYLLIHFDIPYVAKPDWRLRIGGRVRKPLQLDLDAIKRLPSRALPVTMECAGNGRAELARRWPTQPWHHGAVGTAVWTGTPLKHVLERAGLAEDAVDVAFFGADRGFDAGVEHDYGRSLTPVNALGEDVLLAWAMNGAPLLPQHGYPLRLIVPGWYGMASVKWLDRIEVLDKPFDGFQQVRTYMYRDTPGGPGTPVTQIRVKSLMTPPGIPDWYTRGRLCERGPVELSGRAWSGGGVGIAKVEVAIDGKWRQAALDPPLERLPERLNRDTASSQHGRGKFAWRGWRTQWLAEPGEHVLACRATDANGDTQPLEPRWDAGGFGNNCVHRVEVTVR